MLSYFTHLQTWNGVLQRMLAAACQACWFHIARRTSMQSKRRLLREGGGRGTNLLLHIGVEILKFTHTAAYLAQESHRVFPVNMDVISWLGAYHVRHEVYEKAMPFFDLASKVQPQEVKWALMVASCYRRIGAVPQVGGWVGG